MVARKGIDYTTYPPTAYDFEEGGTPFSGAYADLTGKPTLGTAAATAASAYATAAQAEAAVAAAVPSVGFPVRSA